MLKNYVKVALRNLGRQAGYSLINIAGLAVGVACCILILLYVQNEMSYDRHNQNLDQIYRVVLRGSVGGKDFNTATACAPMAQTLVADFPEVVQATRVRSFGFPVMRYQDQVFSEEHFYWADSTFFDVFSATFMQGNARTALTKPNTVVLTRSTAEKYFGSENPIGRSINADNRRDYLVTGVVEDPPETSHFHFDFLGSLATYGDSRSPFWLSNNYYTYILLRRDASRAAVEAKFPELIRTHVAPQIEQTAQMSFEQFVAGGGRYGYFLQPLKEIHLTSDMDYELEANGDARYVTLFLIVAFAILLIACINFMNLATARSAGRAKEVGIRKTVGSHRGQLIRQFLTETCVMSLLAVSIAILLVELLLPRFSSLAGKSLQLNLLGNPVVVPALLGGALLVGLMAGIYPAFFLAAFRPVSILQTNGSPGSGGGSLLRSILVTFQFAVSVMLIVGTLVVRGQLQYIQNKKLGFNKEQVVVVKKTDDLGSQVYPFMQELRQNVSVVSVSNSSTLPGKSFNSNAFRRAGAPGDQTQILWDMRSDHDFARTYEVALTEGRFFSREFATDSTGIVLNESAAHQLGFDQPVGGEIVTLAPTPEQAETYRVVGVVKDFHFESLRQEIRPMAIRLFTSGQFGKYVSVRVAPGEMQHALAQIEHIWQKFAGSQALETVFFDQDFAQLYKTEQITSQVLTLFAALAILIACLGLFGLASFTAEQKTREIGIRKVLGASVPNLVFLLSRRFAKWVLVGSVFAFPVAWLTLHSWLDNFAYRMNLGLTSFVVAALLALLIALLTVSYQTVRAALANPVESLRYE